MLNAVLNKALLYLRGLFVASGILFFFIIIFAFTTGPYYLWHWLGTSASEYHFKPKHILIMGGTGMPSESALMRTYFAVMLYRKYPGSDIYITQPAVSGAKEKDIDAFKMKLFMQELNVCADSVFLEIKGKNTREEALCLIQINKSLMDEPCVLVTSPEHMRRSILTFRKAGFKYTGGEPTFNTSGPSDLLYNDNSLGGNQLPVPGVGESLQLRYQFWNHLRYQVLAYRELFAMWWYQLKGWA